MTKRLFAGLLVMITLVMIVRYTDLINPWIGQVGGASSASSVSTGAATSSLPPSTVDLLVNGSSTLQRVPPGTAVTLTWTSTNAARCQSGPSPTPWGPYLNKAAQGSQQVTVLKNTIFNIECARSLTSPFSIADSVAVILDPTIVAPACGNGIREGAETCDDGNLTSNDCCSASCTLEPGCACIAP